MNIIKRLLTKRRIAKSIGINMIDTDKLLYLMRKEVQANANNN